MIKKLPSNHEKAEEFVNMFSEISRLEGLSTHCQNLRKNEERKHAHQDPLSDNSHYLNANITANEITEAIRSLSNKQTSVGLDAISNEMLKHLPERCTHILQKLFQMCWNSGKMLQLWKKSIVIPILKQGKPRQDKTSYRPIALTSHVCKLMEKIILKRLMHYCDKNSIIPINQAGFQKGKSAIDHLVKLTTQIKRQFARRKNVLATFFDVKKAYDQVWHYRLLQKLKSIGLSGHIYDYLKCFISNRSIQTRIGTSYSSSRTLEMGIPQGSVIAPILFTILLQDLPKLLSKDVILAQYADDICLWMNVTLKKSTPLRSIKYIQKVYQNELNKLCHYLSENGMTLSVEKTHMMLFNSGNNPEKLPVFKIEDKIVIYKDTVKFLGVYLTPKLSWNIHIENILTKARKSLNLLKVIAKQPWGMDTQCLIHLSTSLVRSKLSYGQEVFFSAPKYLLKKLQSLDCKAYKIALGVPFHTSSTDTYNEVGILPLEEHRKLASAKYILRSSTVETYSKRRN